MAVWIQYQAHAEPVLIPAVGPVENQGVSATFPDWIARAILPIAAITTISTQTLAPAFPIPTLSWKSTYADRAPGYDPIIGFEGRYVRAMFTPLGTPLEWRSDYPDTAWQIPQTPIQEHVQTIQFAAPVTIVYPEFPDLLPQPTRLFDDATKPIFTLALPENFNWRGLYPDRLYDRTIVIEANQPTMLDDALPPQFGWHGLYPDQVWSSRITEGWVTNASVSVFPLADPVIWKSIYPDYIWKARIPNEAFPEPSFEPLPITLTTDQLAWRGVYPSWLPLLRPTEYPAFTTGLTASTLPLPTPLVWQGRYVDYVWTKPQRQIEVYRAFLPPTVTDISFIGTRVDGVSRTPLTFGHLLAQAYSPAIPPPTPTAWLGRYPEFVSSAGRSPVFMALAETLLVPTPPLTWRGNYPEFVVRPSRVPLFEPFEPTPLQFVPLLSWKGHYVEWISRLMLPIAAMQSLTTVTTLPTPPLSWRGLWPDRTVLAAAQLDTANQQAWTTGVTSTSILPLPRPLVWQGRWADFARGPEPLPIGAMPATTGRRPLFIAGPEVLRFTGQLAMHSVMTFEMTLHTTIGDERIVQASLTNEDTET